MQTAWLSHDSRPPTASAGRLLGAPARELSRMFWADIRPADIMTREAFENAIVVNSAIGGSTNAPIHLNGIAPPSRRAA